jgi:hypothetical protein
VSKQAPQPTGDRLANSRSPTPAGSVWSFATERPSNRAAASPCEPATGFRSSPARTRNNSPSSSPATRPRPNSQEHEQLTQRRPRDLRRREAESRLPTSTGRSAASRAQITGRSANSRPQITGIRLHWLVRWGSWPSRTFNFCVGVFSEAVVVSLGKLTAGHEEYYDREVAGRAEDYYAMRGEQESGRAVVRRHWDWRAPRRAVSCARCWRVATRRRTRCCGRAQSGSRAGT